MAEVIRKKVIKGNRPQVTKKDGTTFPAKGKKVKVKVPKGQPQRGSSVRAKQKERREAREGHRDTSNDTHDVNLFEWGDGSGEIRVGRTVVKMLKGEEDVASWTTDELIRGAPMHVQKVPTVIPAIVYVELVKRMQAEAQHRFAAELDVAIDMHMAIVKGIVTKKNKRGETIAVNVTPVQMKAIEMIYDRVIGKPAETVVLHDGDAPWMQMMAEGIVGTLPDTNVVDVEVVDDADR
jgi:hypothetical protein